MTAALDRATPDASVAVNEAAGALIVGGVVSTTVTLNESLATLPTLSAAVQVTVALPSGNVVGDAGLQEIAPGRSARPASEPDTV